MMIMMIMSTNCQLIEWWWWWSDCQPCLIALSYNAGITIDSCCGRCSGKKYHEFDLEMFYNSINVDSFVFVLFGNCLYIKSLNSTCLWCDRRQNSTHLKNSNFFWENFREWGIDFQYNVSHIAPDTAAYFRNTNCEIQIEKYILRNTNWEIQIEKYKLRNTNIVKNKLRNIHSRHLWKADFYIEYDFLMLSTYLT